MKVLIVSMEYPPNVLGGIGIHVYNLVRQLKELGVIVEVICQDGSTGFGQHFPELPIVVHRISMRERQFPLNWLVFAERVNEFLEQHGHDYDLVHDHYHVAHNSAAPIVGTVHSLLKREVFEEGCEQFPLIGSLLDLEARSLDASAAQIGVSQQIVDELRGEYNYQKKACRIFNGVDMNLFKRIPLEKFCDVTFTGRFTKRKGILHLLDALSELESTGTYLSVLFCGTEGGVGGHMTKALRRSRHDVFFAVDKSHFAMPRIYSSSKLVALMSDYEPFGLVGIEALACETPIVVTSNVGLLEAMNGDDDGAYVIEPKNPSALASAIRMLLKDEAKRVEMGRLGRKSVQKHYDWDTIGIQTVKVYREVAGIGEARAQL